MQKDKPVATLPLSSLPILMLRAVTTMAGKVSCWA